MATGTRFHGDMFLAKSLRSGHGQKAQHHHGILFGSLNGLNCPSDGPYLAADDVHIS